MDLPETQYAQSGDLYIGYQAVGAGPPLVYIEDFGHCIEKGSRGPGGCSA